MITGGPDQVAGNNRCRQSKAKGKILGEPSKGTLGFGRKGQKYTDLTVSQSCQKRLTAGDLTSLNGESKFCIRFNSESTFRRLSLAERQAYRQSVDGRPGVQGWFLLVVPVSLTAECYGFGRCLLKNAAIR